MGAAAQGRARVLRAALAAAILFAATLFVLHVAPPPVQQADDAGSAGRVSLSRTAAARPSPPPPSDGPDADVCHTHRRADYSGDMAVVWGMGFKLKDAAECCAACQAHARVCGAPDGRGKPFFKGAPHNCGDEPAHACNMWVFCEGGGAATDFRCFSYDIHNHTRGECWLKRQADPSRPTVGDLGTYPPELRAAPRAIWPWAVEERIWPWSMPEDVHWTSGVLLPEGAEGVVTPGEPANFVRWCDKHGPCTGLPRSTAAVA